MSARHLLVFIVAAVLALAVSAGTQVEAQPPDGVPGGGGGGGGGTSWDYAALGDSLATGVGALQGYVPRYADHLEQDNAVSVDLTNLGQNGWTSSDLLDALQNSRRFRQTVSGGEVVTWNIGGNDLMDARDDYKAGTCGGDDNQDCLRATVATFKSNWDAIIVEILSLRSTSDTIIRTMDIYNPYVNEDKADGDFEVLKPYIDDVNNHIATTATNNNIPYAQVYLAFNGPNGDEDPEDKGYLSLDGVHPNDTGHAVIAQLLRDLAYAPLG